MTDRPNDALLTVGKVLALILQGMCALAAGILLLLVPIVILISQDMMTGIVARSDIVSLDASPLAFVFILLLLALTLAAMFRFFGKLRALITSVGEGDPFIPENARHLHAMAWLLLGVEILSLLVGAIRLHLANLANLTEGSDRLDFNLYDLDGILMIIILFILARVFRHGAEMREDLEGTV